MSLISVPSAKYSYFTIYRYYSVHCTDHLQEHYIILVLYIERIIYIYFTIHRCCTWYRLFTVTLQYTRELCKDMDTCVSANS